MNSRFSIMRITILIDGRLIWIRPLTFKRNFNTYHEDHMTSKKVVDGGAQ